jgi:hypothetical protein
MGGPEVRFKFKAPFGGLNHCSQEKTCPSGFVIRPVFGRPSQKPDRWHQPIPGNQSRAKRPGHCQSAPTGTSDA